MEKLTKMNETEIWDTFFELYNRNFSEAYEHAMDNITDESKINDPSFFDRIKFQALNSMQSWHDKTQEELGGQTPRELIETLISCEDVMEKVQTAFGTCDDDIPELLKIKMSSFEEEALVSLKDIALSTSWEGDHANEREPSSQLVKSSGALKLLGESKATKYLTEILDKFCGTDNPDEFIADAFKIYIAGLGDEAIEVLTDKLNEACEEDRIFKNSYEYLLVCLAIVGSESKKDNTFACLRTCFRKMPHKIIGAICIGDYGDKRGIPVLKGYLDRNGGQYDRQMFYEVLSSIKRLGGDISDVKDPFKDFS